ncbi:MAG: hypothetical protein R3362_11935, partial [Rhodothermales bacterium]|nr:hypothetical protein [Rhodothermales bacterium]
MTPPRYDSTPPEDRTREPYASPSLQRLGPLTKFTLGGTGMSTESVTGGGTCTTEPDRSPC